MSYANAIKKDRELDEAVSRSTLDLMEHRWHWTIDETNPERVTIAQYARDIGRSNGTIAKYVYGWELHNSGNHQDLAPSDLLELATVSDEHRIAATAVASARDVSIGSARRSVPGDIASVREAIRELPDREKELVARDLAREVTERTVAAKRSPEPGEPALERAEPLRAFKDTPMGLWATAIRDLSGARMRMARVLQSLRDTKASLPTDVADEIEEEADALILVAEKVKEAARLGTVRISDEELARLLEGD